MAFKQIHDLWSSQKISHETAKAYCRRSRCIGADRLHQMICWTEERELSDSTVQDAAYWRAELEGALCEFRSTETITTWQAQYSLQDQKMMRFKPLLLLGQTRSGKTRKAISIFGHDRTLVINCQGLGSSLPSLRDFKRTQFSCIVFDEVSSQQVLRNKMVFQAGVDPVVLSQSACNAHAYTLYLYGVPMILCTNYFQMLSDENAAMPDADIEYLEKNVINASLPHGEKWYVDEEEDIAQDSGDDPLVAIM